MSRRFQEIYDFFVNLWVLSERHNKELFVSHSVHGGGRESEGVRERRVFGFWFAVLPKDLVDDCIHWLVREE